MRTSAGSSAYEAGAPAEGAAIALAIKGRPDHRKNRGFERRRQGLPPAYYYLQFWICEMGQVDGCAGFCAAS